MKTTSTTCDSFETLDAARLSRANGGRTCDLSGLPSSAREIIMAESGGRPKAKNPHSSAFGVGQLLVANRKALMGSNFASTDCGDQIDAFKRYTIGRYKSFDRALAFRKQHGWY